MREEQRWYGSIKPDRAMKLVLYLLVSCIGSVVTYVFFGERLFFSLSVGLVILPAGVFILLAVGSGCWTWLNGRDRWDWD